MAVEMGAWARMAFERHFDQKHAFAAWKHLLRQANIAQ